MSVLTSLGILIVAMLIMFFMQLVPGVFLLFSHHVYGKYSKIKASDLSLFFILGVELMLALILIILYLTLNAIFAFIRIDERMIFWIFGVIFIILGILFLVFYFRRGDGTNLYISRKCANNFQRVINSTKKRSDAFLLGLISLIPELIFTLPIYLVVVLEIMKIEDNALARGGLIILIVLVSIIPLLVMHILFGSGHNMANIQRVRVKNKLFVRITVSILFLVLATLLIMRVK